MQSARSFEGRRYRDILRQESNLSASKENINGVVVTTTSSKVSQSMIVV